MRTLQINHLAVLASVILLSGLGFLWYGPLFGESWMELNNLTEAMIEENSPGAGIWIANTIATIIPVYVLAWLFVKMNVNTLLKGAVIGLVIGFAFVHLSILTGNLFSMRPYTLSWIDGGYNMVCLAVAGAVLGAWKRYSVSA